MEMKIILPLVLGVLVVIGLAGWYSSSIGMAVVPYAPMAAGGLLGLSSSLYVIVLFALVVIMGALFVRAAR